MRFLRSKPPAPPSKLMRKATEGTEILFTADAEGRSSYWPHVSHRGRVLSVELMPQKHRKSSRAVYTVECECGIVLHPRAEFFTVITPS
jgi:hypothetical protein